MQVAVQTDSVWQAVDTGATIHRAQYRADMGAPYCALIKLTEESFLVYSPGRGLVESARHLLPADPQLLLLAPAAGHTLGLEEWKSAYLKTRVIASDFTNERLRVKTSINGAQHPDSLANGLPDHVRIHVLPDNSLGEVWVSVETEEAGGTVYWLVCDSFMNLATLDGSPILRILMKLYGLGIGLQVHKVFKRGVNSKHSMIGRCNTSPMTSVMFCCPAMARFTITKIFQSGWLI